MKKIKKLFAIGLALLLTLCMSVSLSGCNSGSKRRGFFTYSSLLATGLVGLPKPDFEYLRSESIYRKVYGKIEREEFDCYAQNVLEYLQTISDSMGYPGEIVSDNGPTRIYEYVEQEEKLEKFGGYDEEHEYAVYIFLFIKNKKTDDSIHHTTDYVKLFYTYGEVAVDYNFTVELRKMGNADSYVY